MFCSLYGWEGDRLRQNDWKTYSTSSNRMKRVLLNQDNQSIHVSLSFVSAITDWILIVIINWILNWICV